MMLSPKTIVLVATFVLACLLSTSSVLAQDSLLVEKSSLKPRKKQKKSGEAPKWDIGGYVKYLTSVYVLHPPAPTPVTTLQNNLLHNRINFKWYINDAFTFKADLRSRLFFGEFIKLQPNYGQTIRYNDSLRNGYSDYLSWVLMDEPGATIHSTLDRLYLQYSKGNWDIRLGRQRINWGINTIWNPNDIFNSFTFTDFDYEERPGADALRIQYFTGVASSIEVAAKVFTRWEDATAGFLWKTNKWDYDFQVLAGLLGQNLVLGGGWAGHIKDAGFKGEFSYFFNYADTTASRHSFTGTISIDYLFKNSGYLTAGFMYNSNGQTNINTNQLFAYQPSAQNLYPYRYSIFLTYMQPIKQIINLGATVVYSPGESHAMFISPTFSYSINETWDLSFVGQLAFNRSGNYYISPTQVFFLRFKLSF